MLVWMLHLEVFATNDYTIVVIYLFQLSDWKVFWAQSNETIPNYWINPQNFLFHDQRLPLEMWVVVFERLWSSHVIRSYHFQSRLFPLLMFLNMLFEVSIGYITLITNARDCPLASSKFEMPLAIKSTSNGELLLPLFQNKFVVSWKMLG